MAVNLEEYKRLSVLGEKVKAGTASKDERDEFMKYMYTHDKMSKDHYNQYKSGKNSDGIINAALAIGAVLLIGYLIEQLISNSKK